MTRLVLGVLFVLSGCSGFFLARAGSAWTVCFYLTFACSFANELEVTIAAAFVWRCWS